MANKRFPLVRGRRMRATRLDVCGRIADRACSAIVTKGFISVAMTANIDEGEEISVQNAGGETCVRDAATPSFINYGVAITFCDVDPELYAMMSNQPVVYDWKGDAVGFRVNSGRSVNEANFALELWSGVPGVACEDPTAQGSYGYFLLPFVTGGVLGDFTLENGAVTFTLQNAATKDGTAWGRGPYNVVLGGTVTNEVQTVTVTGTPTGGNFTLTFDGETTANIAHNANAAAVKAALEALDNVDTVTVTGGPGPGTPWVVTFDDGNVPQMTATSAFTGGSSPTATVTTTTPGVDPVPSPLLEPLDAKDHLHVQYTTVAPPEPGEECIPSGPAATGATAGIPAVLTPTDSYPPETFAALSAAPLTATPSSAWTTGQHVVLGNGSHAYWNGTAWVAGDAP